ncbi:hypothetical protein [Streptomyces chattanoogensis]|uniref:hypothetical protein n=1 Tax=Streptomyces chattanoogensis TaxID=66876 RepID=UPI003681B36F
MSGSEKSLKPWDTEFSKKSGTDLRGMVHWASVDHVYEVARNWLDVHDQLVGAEGDNGAGVQGRLAKAVKKVRETWHGRSAEKFSEEAAKVIQDIGRGGTFAQKVSDTMVEAAEALSTAKGEIAKVDWDPPAWGSPYIEYEQAIQEGVFDDPGLELQSQLIGQDRYRRLGDAYKSIQADLAGGLTAKQILAMYKPDADGDLLRGEPGSGLWMPKFQRQALESAAAMETLATSYKKHARDLKPPEQIKGARPIGERPSGGPKAGTSIPKGGLPGGGTPPTGLISGGAPGGALGGPSGLHGPGWSPPDVPDASHGPGTGHSWSGGGHDAPPVSTGLDSFPSGGGAAVADRGLPGGGYTGHGGGSVPTGGGSGGSGFAGGLPGVPGGLGLPGSPSGGPAPSSSSAARSAAGTPGATSGARTGPGRGTGSPGMPGAAGAARAGAGAGKGAVAGRGGALARKPGGAAGAPGGAAGGTAQGGSGLHRSRGGSQAGRSPAGRGAGAMGAPGANGAAAKRRSERTAERQSYLVEDEETWTPRRNTVPRVIE